MSRSKHTRPRRIRARERVRDRGRARADLPALHELPGEWPLPRVVVRKPRPGFAHLAGRADVEAILRFLGERAVYGLRGVTLARGTSVVPGEELGRLVAPGEIELYDQPPPPWLLPLRPSPAEVARVLGAGARIEGREAGAVAVHWPLGALRDFLLLDVLLHEIGHHVLQHESRKPAVPAARTADHEAFAERFARRERERWREAHA